MKNKIAHSIATAQMKKHRRPLLLAAAALALLPAVRSDAAMIAWDTPTLITADANVSTTGSLLYAYTFGATGVASATVNGVTFAPFEVSNNGSSPETVGSTTLSAGFTFFSTNTGLGAATGAFAALSSAYQGLLKSGVSLFGGDQFNLSLGGLTSGVTYIVQIWANESTEFKNDLPSNGVTQVVPGNFTLLDINNTNATGGVGQWVTGTFIADSTDQYVAISGSAAPDLNAVMVRSVPEPSTYAMLLGGVAGLFFLRRRRKMS